MTYASICSGIEAATVAWEPLGWRPAWFAEIDKFPSAVLAHHYPGVPNRGDFTQIQDSEPVGLLVGGTPCQSFSIAGKRAGLDDPRGNLTLEWLALAARLRPRWLVWENVPGVLSDDGGRTLGTVLGTLGQLGYGFAYRVLDAQHFGVPQRRRRVFVVGCLGDWRRAATVLFERHSLSRHPAPRREAGEDVAPTISASTKGGGGLGPDFDCDGGLIAFNLRGREDGAQVEPDELASLRAASGGSSRSYVAFDETQITSRENRTKPPGSQENSSTTVAVYGSAVRRLTPRECERLQGFPDDYTLIPYRGKPAADGPRYKALGNSMAVPVMRWIGERIAMVNCATAAAQRHGTPLPPVPSPSSLSRSDHDR